MNFFSSKYRLIFQKFAMKIANFTRINAHQVQNCNNEKIAHERKMEKVFEFFAEDKKTFEASNSFGKLVFILESYYLKNRIPHKNSLMKLKTRTF